MDPEIYKKIGRGGAGNYYSKQDIDDAAKRVAEVSCFPPPSAHRHENPLSPVYQSQTKHSKQDVEAQNHHAVPSSQSNNAGSDYAYSGRGGAGNLVKREGQSQTAARTTTLQEHTIPDVGYSGRGGAGNLRGGEMERRRVENERLAREARERAHDEVVKGVELGLKMPERAHLGGEKLG